MGERPWRGLDCPCYGYTIRTEDREVIESAILNVHNPLGLGAGGEPALERARVRQGGELPVEGKPSPIEGGAEQREELAPEHAAEHAHRQEESWPAGNPAGAVG